MENQLKVMNKTLLVYTLTTVFFTFPNSLFSQSGKIKEEYDFYTKMRIFTSLTTTPYDPCSKPPQTDAKSFGDGMSKVLEGYVSMHQATGHKAYLYKFLFQSLCIMENRHDFAQVKAQHPKWNSSDEKIGVYGDGYIIAGLSRFVHYIKKQEPQLMNEAIYPFDQLDPNQYAPNTCNCNKFGITFSTFGQYANWLEFEEKSNSKRTI